MIIRPVARADPLAMKYGMSYVRDGCIAEYGPPEFADG
jgi:hypothetical protein